MNIFIKSAFVFAANKEVRNHLSFKEFFKGNKDFKQHKNNEDLIVNEMNAAFPNELVDRIASELAEVRNSNEDEGSKYFQAFMDMIQEDDRYNKTFNLVCAKADKIAAGGLA